MAGLYIHVPFCGQKCAYCDFYSLGGAGSDGAVRGFLDALGREMESRRGFFADRRLDTIYVGGGTPSLLSPVRLREMLDRAAQTWDCSRLREVTVEANPEDLTDEYLAALATSGFDRLSIGVQSFDDGLLRYMNRRHSAARARDAVRAAQKAGFGNISIDLIFGIPGMSAGQWGSTLDVALDLGVQHISAYHLTIEPGTSFGRMKLRPAAEAESEQQYGVLGQRLGEAGFEHYEISNFALPSRRAVHNSAYWSGEPYLGLGPSAHSYDGRRTRSWVAADLAAYISHGGDDAIHDAEILTDTDLRNERIMTGLRRVEGIPAGSVSGGECARSVQKLLADGSLVRRGDNLAIPPEKFLLSDYIIAALFEA